MQIGLFSNGQRHNELAKVSYQEDLDELILADQLGMSEAWISEHGTFVSHHSPDQLPCADLLICKAATLTKNIKFGPGIRPLPYFHPLQVATDCAVCDHLLDGRYMAGFGLGLGGGGEPRGKLPGHPRDMAHEAIDLILKAWTTPEPFDWDGRFWQGRNWKIIPKPLTKPHMNVGMACSRSDSSLKLSAERGFFPLLSWSAPTGQLAEMIKTFVSSPTNEIPAARERVRIARFVYVSDSIESAKKDLHGADLGSARNGRLDAFLPQGGTRDDLSIESLIDCGAFFCGSPDQVADQIRRFHDEVGGFGTLLVVAGKDWGSLEGRRRSMQLLMEEVAPRVASLSQETPVH
jgi:alkanesulfonate monooxygenase SsuD/methylene tetrahydromethanopterin reductase-like flavin-dependent oxidoreductase (luciferase family)